MTGQPATGGRLLLLGSPRVHSDRGATDLPETAPAFLIVHLAVLRQWAPREAVAALLWPELPDDRGQHNLRVALNRAGALLARVGLESALVAERRRIRLDASTDLADFRDALVAADWARACTLADAPLLDGVRCQPYPALAEWMTVEREAQRRQWRRALAEASQAAVLPEAALGRYLAAYPADAEMATLQVARLAATRRLAEARDVVEGFRRAAADELAPAEVDAAARQIERAASGASSAASLAADAGVVGREQPLAALADAVATHRLVTVTGLPGVGKSTLLRAFAAPRRPGRAVTADDPRTALVEVGERSTAAGIIERIVAGLTGKPALRIKTDDGLRLLETASGVLLLDGIDQAPAAAGLIDLLAALRVRAHGVHLLVSSRRPLAVDGEHVITLGGLPTATAAGEPLGSSPAATLFLREARRARPGFELDAGPEQVDRIVQASGGLPLALKLAAGWTRWLGPEAISAELERSLRRDRGVLDPSLHEMMRATWQRLDARESEAIHSLSLMPGSFDMAAAVRLGDAPASVIEALASSGLLELRDGAATGPRLLLHPLIKAYASEQLDRTPPRRRQATRRFVEWLRDAYGEIPTIEGQPALRSETVGPLIDVTVQGWGLALETGALDALPWLLSALQSWHEDRGEYRTGLARLDMAQGALDESVAAEAAVLGSVQLARATLAYQMGDHDRSAELSLAAVRLARATGQARLLRRALNMLGLNRWQQMRLDEAQDAIEEAMVEAVAHDDRKGQRAYIGNLGLLDKARGRYASAEARYRQSLAMARELDRIAESVFDLNNLANLLRHLGRFEEAESLALEALRLCHEHEYHGKRPRMLLTLAMIDRSRGQPQRSLERLALLDACGSGVIEGGVAAEAATLRARIALDLGSLDEARSCLVDALRWCQRTEHASARLGTLANHGRWLWKLGRRDEAHALWLSLLAAALDAPLRDELTGFLLQHGLSAHAQLPQVDLPLLVETLLSRADV